MSHIHSDFKCTPFAIIASHSLISNTYIINVFCVYIDSFTLQANPGPPRPARRIFDCVRRKISAILISQVGRRVDVSDPLSLADTYRRCHTADNRILWFH